MDGGDEIQLMEHPDSTEEIPMLDISSYMAGEPGARERIGARLREISETVGFFYLVGHGVPQAAIDAAFAQSRRLHESPLEVRRSMPKFDRTGYQGVEDRQTLAATQKPSLNSTLNMVQERPPGHPKLDPSKPFRRPNVWPDWLPGFKEGALDYQNTLHKLAKQMLPLWAAALDLPADYFDAAFADPHLIMSMVYYPPQKEIGNRRYGIPPHTDNCFMTILAQGNVPGLAVQMPSGHWLVADVTPGAFVVNSGNTMVRFTNGRFKSTRHRVINTNEVDRYSIPFFFAPDLDAMVECVPTCVTAEKPAEYPPIRYEDFYHWYQYSEGIRGFEKKSAGPGSKSEELWLPQDQKAGQPTS